MTYIIMVLVLLPNGPLSAWASEEQYFTLQSCELAKQARVADLARKGLSVVASQCAKDTSGRDA